MRSLFLNLLIIILPTLVSAQCPSSNDITFYQQADLDSFSVRYPNCTEYGGNIRIAVCHILINDGNAVDHSIYNLSPLSNLKSLNNFSIGFAGPCIYNKPIGRQLSSLSGLHNLENLNSFGMSSGFEQIQSLQALSQIKNLKYLDLEHTSKISFQ